MKRLIIRVSLNSLVLFPLAFHLSGEGSGGARGIQRLNPETHAEAQRCGESGGDCAVAPYRLCPSDNRRYSAWIATPFSRVAASIYEAEKRHERPRPMSQGSANGWGVGIYVYPAEEFEKADSIDKVVIRREGKTIEPETTTLAPVRLLSPVGLKKEVSKGFFAFAMDVFEPTADITVVFTGSTGESTCTLHARTLANLR